MDLLRPAFLQISQRNCFPVGVVTRQGAERVGQRARLPHDGGDAGGVTLFLAVEHPGCRVEGGCAVEDDFFVELVPGHGRRYTVTPAG